MTKRELIKIYAQVAKHYGVSVAEVRREIELVIHLAKSDLRPEVQEKWASIPYKGCSPEAEEVIAHLVDTAKRGEG